MILHLFLMNFIILLLIRIYIIQYLTIIFRLKLSNTKRKRAFINYRNIKTLNINDFSNDIINSFSNCNINLDYFNSSILNLLDIYSPIRRFLVTIHYNCPLFNSELKNELHNIKRHLRKHEHLYKIKSSNTTFVNYRYFYRSYILIDKKCIIIILLVPFKIILERFILL